MQAQQDTKKMVLVVAVALIDQQQRVLLAQRPEGKTMAGLWEFPGGKVCELLHPDPQRPTAVSTPLPNSPKQS
jgi:adenine-specific DNA glycosylase